MPKEKLQNIMNRLIIKLAQISLIFVMLFTAFSCRKNEKKLSLSDEQQIEVKINRFDSLLIYLNTNDLHDDLKGISSRYPDFYSVYFSDILGFASNDTIGVSNAMKMFVTDSTMMKVNENVMKTFGNVTDIEKEISKAFSIFHFYFKDVKLPKIFFFVSGFNQAIYADDDIIAVGTDMYLGQDYQLYDGITYGYMKYGMQKKFISVDLLNALIVRQFGYDTDKERLIDNIIYRGKLLYLLSVMLPDRNPEDILCFTPEQIKWCEKYEKQVWGTIVDQKDLFSSDNQLISKYINPAPFTNPVSPDSPGRLGLWVGYRIVSSYMEKNGDVTVRDLMRLNDYQTFLQQSGYRP